MVAEKAAKPTSYWFVGVSPRSIRNLLLAMGDRTYAWSELLALVQKKAILDSNSKDVNLDTLVWQHERIARLLGMSEKRDAHYMVTSATRNSIGTRGLQDPLQPKERRFFVERVFQSSTQPDSPLTRFLSRFIKAAPPWDEAEFRLNAKPIHVQTLRKDMVAFLDSFGTGPKELTDPEEITEFWGCRPFAIDLLILDEIRLRYDRHHPSSTTHVVYPVKQILEEVSPEYAREIIRSYIDQAFASLQRISIPQLMYQTCVREGITTSTFKHLLMLLYQHYPTEFYFDRVPSVLIHGREASYVKLDGEWRSYVVPRGG